MRGCCCRVCAVERQRNTGPEDWKPTFYDPDSGGDPVSIECECGIDFSIESYDYYETRLAWNTRAPVLGAEEMETLRGRKHDAGRSN